MKTVSRLIFKIEIQQGEKMKKVLIVFGSTTGNTEDMADTIKRILDASGCETEVRNVLQTRVKDLTAGHDVLLLGCPAYGDDTIELQGDFQDFYEELDGVRLEGKPFAVFAPGDMSYEYFCGSVDMLEDRMEELGGRRLVEGLKVDGDPYDAEDEIVQWAKAVAFAVH